MEIDQVNGVAVARAGCSETGSAVQLPDAWGEELVALCAQLDPPVLVVDVGGVQQMRPRAMAGLIQGQRKLRERGGELVLAGPEGALADLIQITGFGREIHIAASCDDAIAYLTSQSAGEEES